MFCWHFEVYTCSRFWRWNLINICVIWTQPSGPLCLWQCFIIIHPYSSKRYLVTYCRLWCIYSRQSALNGRRYCAGWWGDKCAPGRVAVWVTRVQPVPIAMHWGQSRRRGARADHWQGCSESETQPSLGQPYAFPLRRARTHPPFILRKGRKKLF